MVKRKSIFFLIAAMLLSCTISARDITPIISFLLDESEISCVVDNVPPVGRVISIEVVDGRLNSLELPTLFFDENCDVLSFELVDDDGIFFAEIFGEELNFSSLFGTGPYTIIVQAIDPEGESAQSSINITLK